MYLFTCPFAVECGHRYGSYPASSWFNSGQPPLFPTISFLDFFFFDWTYVIGFFFVFPLCYFFFLFIYYLYLLFWRSGIFRMSCMFFFFTFFVWFSLSLGLFLSWHAPTVNFFQSHLVFSNTSLRFLVFTFCLTFGCLFVFISPFFSSLINEVGFVFSTAVLFLFMLSGLLLLTTNLYTLIFLIEFLNLLVFILLCVFNAGSLFANSSKKLSLGLNSVLLFFWINAIASISFFILFIFTSQFGLAEFTSKDFFLIFFDVDELFLSVAVFLLCCIFFYKLGLPPLLLWKLRLFEATQLGFIFIYNLPYFLFILLVFFLIITSLVFFDTFIISVLISLVFFAFILILPASLRSINLSYLFALSSSLTALLLLFVFLISNNLVAYGVSVYVNTTPTLLYLFYYFITFILMISLLLTTGSGFSLIGNVSLSNLTLNSYLRNFRLLRSCFFVCIFSFAGLPPLTSFFYKLKLLVEVFSSPLPLLLFLPVLGFIIFISILFYFRILRFFTPTWFKHSRDILINKAEIPQKTKFLSNTLVYDNILSFKVPVTTSFIYLLLLMLQVLIFGFFFSLDMFLFTDLCTNL